MDKKSRLGDQKLTNYRATNSTITWSAIPRERGRAHVQTRFLAPKISEILLGLLGGLGCHPICSVASKYMGL